MIEPRADRPTPFTLGADKTYDAEDFVNELALDERDAACCTEPEMFCGARQKNPVGHQQKRPCCGEAAWG
jgi:hypothetical protein